MLLIAFVSELCITDFAGTPNTVVFSGISFTTTEPIPTNEFFEILIPFLIFAPGATYTLSSKTQLPPN